MESQGIFNETILLLEKALALRAGKHNLIASNIANMDTPDYKAFDFIVEEELAKTTTNISIKKTRPGHMPVTAQYTDNIKYHKVKPSQYNLRGDGNTVDLDKSMANLAENSLMYNASAQIIGKKFQGLKNAIQGGNR